MEGATGIKWAKRARVIPVKGLVINWRAVLLKKTGRTAGLPLTVSNNMLGRDIIDQRDRLAFLDGNATLGEVGIAHMHRWASSRSSSTSIVNAAGGQNGCQNRQEHHSSQQFFIHTKTPSKSSNAGSDLRGSCRDMIIL